MSIAAFFRRTDIPGHTADFFIQDTAGAVKDPDGVRRQLSIFSILQVNDIPRIGDQGGHIRRKEIFSDADAEYQRAGLPDGKYLFRLLRADHAQCIGSLQTVCCSDQGFPDTSPVIHFDQVDDHFRIRLALKMISSPGQLFPQLQIVFDNAVMHDGKFPVIGQMRMRVLLCRSAVCRPSGMSYACGARNRFPLPGFFAQARDPPRHLADSDPVLIHHSYPGGIISAVFQLFQSFQQNRGCLLSSGKSYDSTHNHTPLSP